MAQGKYQEGRGGGVGGVGEGAQKGGGEEGEKHQLDWEAGTGKASRDCTCCGTRRVAF